MKISEAWLREWVDPAIETDKLAHILTMAGLEVDGVEAAVAPFSGVVIGQIEAVEPHPDAEKLRVCTVTDGNSNFQVVCGAPNVAVGQKVPFAKVGATLASDDQGKTLAIKKAKLRGVESFGMLCGASELGLEDIVDGLLILPDDAPVGEDLYAHLKLDDAVIEVDLTPNRGDCLSVLGIAREVGVLTSTDLNWPTLEAVAAQTDASLPIVLTASEYCSRYAGRVIRNVNIHAETPLWMREKLRRAGLRSIDAIVDITNYVMLELGQPLHAFDADKIEGGINVRMAEQGEKIELLDDSTVSLDSDMLVIADRKQALAVAGVMGGAHSAVSDQTQHIFFESAFFAPARHAGKARKLGMHTDASHRFERGVDHLGQERAVERATQLLLAIAGGEAGPVSVVESNGQGNGNAGNSESRQVVLREKQIERILGFAMAKEQVDDILSRLELSPQRKEEGQVTTTVPSHRFDIAIEADLLEELARIYGYERLPVEPPLAPMTFALKPEAVLPVNSFRQLLVARGYRETINYSFIDPAVQQQFFPHQQAVALANPIASDMSIMRTSLLPGLVNAAIYNLSRQQKRLKLFETGLSFVINESGMVQVPMLSGLLCGERLPESWFSKSESVAARGQKPDDMDFYDLKADIESILAMQGQYIADLVEFKSVEAGKGLDYLHPGQSAVISIDGEELGYLGQIHPQLKKTLGLTADCWLFELKLDLISAKKVPEFKELSKFPEVRRDLAVIVDQAVAIGDVLTAVRHSAGQHLNGLVVFDQYSGEGVGEGLQSIGLGLTWQHTERTLNDEEVASLTDEVVAALKRQFNASLR